MSSIAIPVSAPRIGSLVSARERDWVVLPAAEENVVRLRPLTGSEEDATGIFLPLERWKKSEFLPPDPDHSGDTQGGLLLLDAARLALRDGAAPFRSMGRISVTPRPYQFVPLIMALRQDPVRLLVADDVGVGKTIEAAMIAREMLDRGLAQRLAVICPAHLCEQWEKELREKFGIEAAVIQPSRFARLERELPRGDLSVFRYHRHLIASIDFVKAGVHRHHFLENAPDLIIVDEAHVAARPRGDRGQVQHQRYEFVRGLASDPTRHVILVTATPHSGIEESFRSLLGLLDQRFDAHGLNPPPELDRSALVPHVVQRRRDDLAHWPGGDTPFPQRESKEHRYALSADYYRLFEDVLAYCRGTVDAGRGLRAQQQRVRHWAAIALLRCVLSSPAAASSVLSARAKRLHDGEAPVDLFESPDDADAAYRPQVLDAIGEEQAGDYVPAAPLEDAEPFLDDAERRRLAGFLKGARNLEGPVKDAKLAEAGKAVGDALRDGFRPIVFCRFIATANYVAASLGKTLGKEFPGLRAVAVTGEIGHEERRAIIDELVAEPGPRVLVATDCLSEGINLQEHVDAVLHYDLPWNPNRLEQREGRVDRFGQAKPVVRVGLLYGADNPIDGVVLDVLIRKARTIRNRLGIAIPVPEDTEQVVQAVVESVLLRGRGPQAQLQLDFGASDVSRLHATMDAAAEKEASQRRYFAQRGIKPEEVAREVAATVPVLGDEEAVQRFLANAAQRLAGSLRATGRNGVFDLYPGDLADDLERRGYEGNPLRVTFDALTDPDAHCLGRTHPVVSAYCDAVLGKALGPEPDARFARCGAVFTNAVTRRTAVVLLRLRYLLREKVEEFAEEVVLVAIESQGGQPRWIEPLDTAARELLTAADRPVANMSQSERAEHVQWALGLLDRTPSCYQPIVQWRVEQLQASHNRLRKLVKASPLKVDAHDPDLLGCYVLVPGGSR
ncbi:MAG: helicase-related protein [Thermomicrobiales bacterium]